MVRTVQEGEQRMSEKILVFPKHFLYGFEGFDLEPPKERSNLLTLVGHKHNNEWLDYVMGHTTYMYRDMVEEDENFIQIIPYGVLIEDDKIFTYERSGSEDRLHNLRSLGLGGHMNRSDMKDCGKALMREMCEELKYGGVPLKELVKEGKCSFKAFASTDLFDVSSSLIYDVSSPVNKVHLGVVIPVSLDMKEKVNPSLVKIVGEGKKSEWASILNLRLRKAMFEPWSQLVIDNM